MYMDILKGQPYVIQEFLREEDQEYTCCVFKTPDMGEPYSIALKRKLLNGTTISAEVVFDDLLSGLCEEISCRFPMEGSLNVQVRKKNDIPYVFEINPRYSSTSYIRAICGFNDVEMGIQFILGRQIPDKLRIDKRKIIRYWEEHCISYS
jgi:carbamoyl-phosphate synthase large subunit